MSSPGREKAHLPSIQNKLESALTRQIREAPRNHKKVQKTDSGTPCLRSRRSGFAGELVADAARCEDELGVLGVAVAATRLGADATELTHREGLDDPAARAGPEADDPVSLGVLGGCGR
jgi:hypothetical protein